MKVYLDDEREAPEGWQLVKSANNAIELLKQEIVTEISLDHGLGNDNQGTGYDVILWIEMAIVEKGFKPPKIYIHSANSSARIKMELGIKKIMQFKSDKSN